MNKTANTEKNVKHAAIMLVLIQSSNDFKLDAGGLEFAIDVYKTVTAINKTQKLKLPTDDTIQITVNFIREVAKGKDGIIGTSDDIIDPKTTQQIVDMLSSNLLEDMLRLLTYTVKLELSYKTSLLCLTKWCCIR